MYFGSYFNGGAFGGGYFDAGALAPAQASGGSGGGATKRPRKRYALKYPKRPDEQEVVDGTDLADAIEAAPPPLEIQETPAHALARVTASAVEAAARRAVEDDEDEVLSLLLLYM